MRRGVDELPRSRRTPLIALGVDPDELDPLARHARRRRASSRRSTATSRRPSSSAARENGSRVTATSWLPSDDEGSVERSQQLHEQRHPAWMRDEITGDADEIGPPPCHPGHRPLGRDCARARGARGGNPRGARSGGRRVARAGRRSRPRARGNGASRPRRGRRRARTRARATKGGEPDHGRSLNVDRGRSRGAPPRTHEMHPSLVLDRQFLDHGRNRDDVALELQLGVGQPGGDARRAARDAGSASRSPCRSASSASTARRRARGGRAGTASPSRRRRPPSPARSAGSARRAPSSSRAWMIGKPQHLILAG